MIKQQRHDALAVRSYDAAVALCSGAGSWRFDSNEPRLRSDVM